MTDKNSLIQIKDRADVLYSNGFGFQPCGSKGELRFAICRTSGEQTGWVSKIGRKIGVPSLQGVFQLSCIYMTIDYSDYDKIDAIFTYLIKKGHVFVTHNNPELVLGRPDGPSKYNSEIAEREIIRQHKYHHATWKREGKEYMFFKRTHESLCDPWNYNTPEGKEFCAWLRQGMSELWGKCDNSVVLEDSKDNYLNWDQFKGFDMKSLLVSEN